MPRLQMKNIYVSFIVCVVPVILREQLDDEDSSYSTTHAAPLKKTTDFSHSIRQADPFLKFVTAKKVLTSKTKGPPREQTRPNLQGRQEPFSLL